MTLIDKYRSLEGEISNIHEKYERLGSLENAEGEMLVLGNRLKEL